MNQQPATWLWTLVFVSLIGFGLYRRFKQTFGWQPVAPRRMAVRMAMLSIIGVLLLVVWLPTFAGFGAAMAGLALGLVLAAVGVSHTTFEVNPRGKFYLPNKWIGMMVTALFLGRLAARLFTLSQHAAQVASSAATPAALQRSPFTVGVFFLLAGYYVSYYASVLRKARGLSLPPG